MSRVNHSSFGWITVVLFLLGIRPLEGKSQGNDCKDEVRQMLKEMHDHASSGTSTLMVKMSIIAAPRDSVETDVSKQAITMVSNKDKLRYESAEMSVYADANLTVTVIPGEKVIYLSPGLSDRNTGHAPTFAMAGANVLEGAAVVQCKRIDKGEYSGKKVLEISKGTGKLEQSGVRSVRYVYDVAGGKIQEVRVNYLPSKPTAYITIRYETFDLNNKGIVFEGSVRSKFFDSGKETLKGEYKGYQVIKTNPNL